MDSNPVIDYINTLTDLELIALNVAKSHLESSFDLERSNGYQEYIKTLNKNIETKTSS